MEILKSWKYKLQWNYEVSDKVPKKGPRGQKYTPAPAKRDQVPFFWIIL